MKNSYFTEIFIKALSLQRNKGKSSMKDLSAKMIQLKKANAKLRSHVCVMKRRWRLLNKGKYWFV